MPSLAASRLTGLRILVVDDEYLVAEYILAVLEGFGCDVVGPVATIEEALALVRSERLDGVLLDANLNGKSSTPVAAALVAKATPFIVVTGYGQMKLATDALNGAPRLTKPFHLSELEKVLAATFLA
ncbi:MAG TPA: response regulator [Stellaceae bacterium]|nr:response regulator [Stellaceae bacterium]